MPTIKEQARAELQKAQAIVGVADAAKRAMTVQETAEVDGHVATARALMKQLGDSDGQAAVRAALGGLNGDRTGGSTAQPGSGFKARAAEQWAKKAEEALQVAMRGPAGGKALVSGSIEVPSVVGEAVQMPVRPTSVLDLIRKPNSPATGEGAAFQFLRQTARTNNADAVADGAIKPTSVHTFTDVEDRFRVYAHLSEALPLRYLTDFRGLTDILRAQLGEGLLEAIEDDVIAGATGGENFVGILNTSGVQTQAFATDLLTTLSNAKWKILNAYAELTAWVLTPANLQALELLKDTTGRFLFDGRDGIEAFLGGPVVTNAAMPANTALVGDFRTVELLVREDDRVDVDTAGSLFERNQFRMRVEGRYGLKVGRPGAFVKVTTSA